MTEIPPPDGSGVRPISSDSLTDSLWAIVDQQIMILTEQKPWPGRPGAFIVPSPEDQEAANYALEAAIDALRMLGALPRR